MKNYNTYDKYKDSGIEWLGEIPEEWEVKRLKNIIESRTGYAFPSSLFSLPETEGIPVVRISDLNIDGFVKLNE